MSSLAARPDPPALAGRGAALALRLPARATLVTFGLAAVLVAIALKAGGGLQLGPLTSAEIALELIGGALLAVAILVDDNRPRYGGVALVLIGALVVLTGVSTIWSVNPGDTWTEANRTLAYASAFAAGIALVRIAGDHWAALLGATVIATTAICAYALLTKVFPGALNPNEVYARLREPYGYWNAVGLTAALGVPGCLWLGSRRSGHAAFNALAFPAMGVLVLTMLLAYSRGSLLAAAVGCAFWFAVVPLRLRGFVVLATGSIAAVLVAAWAFGQGPLSEDRIDVGLRASSGHELGVAIVTMLLLLLAVGLASGFVAARRAPDESSRRRAGVAILVALGFVPVLIGGVLALSDRGLTGSISHGWESLTDPHASTPPNQPDRLTAVGSVRARYWNEALKIFKARPLSGAGAGGYATARPRFREDTLDVRHAHGYVVQTLADLGLVGLAVSLALLAAWLAAALRAVRPADARAFGYPPERCGLLTLLTVVIVFGVHSFVDWTWFVPGTAVLALVCAGWVAGRGPFTAAPGMLGALGERLRGGIRAPVRAGAAAAVALVALVAAWATFQPLHAVHKGDDALAKLEAHNISGARTEAQDAHDINPLSVEPLFDLAVIETAAARKDAARTALEDAVHLQPSNSETWLRLAEFELYSANDPRGALEDLGPALHLDPRSAPGIQALLEVNRRLGNTAPANATATP